MGGAKASLTPFFVCSKKELVYVRAWNVHSFQISFEFFSFTKEVWMKIAGTCLEIRTEQDTNWGPEQREPDDYHTPYLTKAIKKGARAIEEYTK